MRTEKKTGSFLRRQAREIKIYRTLTRLIPIILSIISIVLVLGYIVSVMYTRFGSFTVSVNKYHQLQYGLSLSEDRYFTSSTARLDCRAAEQITNIDGADLDGIDLGAVDGNDSGENYLCYTFYCKNTGRSTLSFEYGVYSPSMTMNVEKAVRVRMITSINGENVTKTDYARAAGVDENGNSIPEPGTTEFFNKSTVMQSVVENFHPGDMMKITVVVWLEGNDPDCVDSIIGGVMKLDMKFNVLNASDVES